MRRLLIACQIAAAAALAAVGQAYAKDYGVLGPLYPIIEVDIRRLVMESAARVDWNSVQQQAKDGARRFLDTLPQRQLPSPARTHTRWLDPSIVITSDIQAPVRQADGSFRWEVIVARGTRFNPLSQVRPHTAMFFYDGANPDQLALLKALLAAQPLVVVPVEAGAGSVRQTSEATARPIFHASDALLSRFQVQELPSLVYPGDGARQMYLGVTAFAPPFDPAAVLRVWSGFRLAATQPLAPAAPSPTTPQP
jgi:conjugal transfer pilus assembly protein TraW